ncbi:hypothetical protein ABPG74_016821 [Tetrahymena malaccensis]
MKLVALTSRKIVWSLSECQNFSKENIYEIFVQLSKNQILEKFHFNFLSNNDLESKDYSKLYSYLQDNPKLKSLNCPHYGIMLQGTLDLFHKNQNINRLQVSILDMVYYKVIYNFMSQIRKSFNVLKFKQMLLNTNLINQFQNLFKVINNLSFKTLKIKNLKFSQKLNENLIQKLFFQCDIQKLEISLLQIDSLDSAKMLIQSLSKNLNLRKITIKSIYVQSKENTLSLDDIMLHDQLKKLKVRFDRVINPYFFESLIPQNSQLATLSINSFPLTNQITNILTQIPTIQKMSVCLNEVDQLNYFIKNIKTNLLKLQLNFTNNFQKELLQNNNIQNFQRLEIQAEVCKIFFAASYLEHQQQKILAKSFLQLIQNSQRTYFSLNFQESANIFLQKYIDFDSIQQPNIISLKFQSTYKSQIQQEKKKALTNKVAFDKLIYEYLEYFPNHIYQDLYY